MVGAVGNLVPWGVPIHSDLILQENGRWVDYNKIMLYTGRLKWGELYELKY